MFIKKKFTVFQGLIVMFMSLFFIWLFLIPLKLDHKLLFDQFDYRQKSVAELLKDYPPDKINIHVNYKESSKITGNQAAEILKRSNYLYHFQVVSEMVIKDMVFNNDVYIVASQFEEKITFLNCSFEKGLYISTSTFEENFEILNSHIYKKAYFFETNFEKESKWTNSTLENIITLIWHPGKSDFHESATIIGNIEVGSAGRDGHAKVFKKSTLKGRDDFF